MIKIANAQLWVQDQDEALAFYTDKVGMEVRADVTVPELGNFRWLTVGLAGQDVSIADGHPRATRDGCRDDGASQNVDGERLRRHDLLDDGRLPGLL